MFARVRKAKENMPKKRCYQLNGKKGRKHFATEKKVFRGGKKYESQNRKGKRSRSVEGPSWCEAPRGKKKVPFEKGPEVNANPRVKETGGLLKGTPTSAHGIPPITQKSLEGKRDFKRSKRIVKGTERGTAQEFNFRKR